MLPLRKNRTKFMLSRIVFFCATVFILYYEQSSLLQAQILPTSNGGAGTLDPSFSSGRGLEGNIRTMLRLQYSGKAGHLMVAGNFKAFGTPPLSTPDFNRLAQKTASLVRLLPDGELDTTFSFSIGSFVGILAIAEQKDGKLLVAGNFKVPWQFFGVPLIRIYPDGSLDSTFRTVSAFANTVRSITLRPDGTIIVGGDFESSSSTVRQGLLQLTSSGEPAIGSRINAGLCNVLGTNNVISSMVNLSDSTLLLIGSFSSYVRGITNTSSIRRDTVPLKFIARLNPNDTIDETYQLPISISSILNTSIQVLTRLQDNSIILLHTSSSGGRLLRLLPNNQLDTAWMANVRNINGQIRSATTQKDGKILLGGDISVTNLLYPSYSVIRLNINGSLDTTFRMNKVINNDQFLLTQILTVDSDSTCIMTQTRDTYSTESFLQRFYTRDTPTNTFLVASPPDGVVLEQYLYRFIANGAPEAIYSLSNKSASLPSGMTLSTQGVLSGKVMFPLRIDSLIIKAGNKLGFIDSPPLAITFKAKSAPKKFITSAPPNSQTNTEYLYQLVADGLPAPVYSLAPNSGELPKGLTLGRSGIIFGNSSGGGIFPNIIVRATNDQGFIDSPSYSITTGFPPKPINFVELPNGIIGEQYIAPIIKAEGAFPFAEIKLSPYSGRLPKGITIATNGTFSGIPTEAGIFQNLIFVASNGIGIAAQSRPYSIVIRDPKPPTEILIPKELKGYADDIFLSTRCIADGQPQSSFSLSSRSMSLPPGILLSPSGIFYGIASTTGTWSNIVVQAKNKVGVTESTTLTIVISSEANVKSAISSIDPSLDLGRGFQGHNGGSVRVVVLLDSLYIVGGNFESYNGVPRSNIAVLNRYGSLDSAFANVQINIDPGNSGNLVYDVGRAYISFIAPQKDGSLFLSGLFNRYNGAAVSSFVRVNKYGQLDSTFKIELNGSVQQITSLENGKWLIAGSFTTVNGIARPGLARLTSNGGVDTTFVPRFRLQNQRAVHSLNIVADGKILIAGGIKAYLQQQPSSQPAFTEGIARLSSNGELDTSFRASSILNFSDFSSEKITHCFVQSDGRIIAVGEFTSPNFPLLPKSPNGTTAVGIIRLNANGVLDTAALAMTSLVATGVSQISTITADPFGGWIATAPISDPIVRNLFLPRTVRLDSIGRIDDGITLNLPNSYLNGILIEQGDSTALIWGGESVQLARVRITQRTRKFFTGEKLSILNVPSNTRYSSLPDTLAMGKPIQPFTIAADGLPKPLYSLDKSSPSLPQGLNLSEKGVLSGTPSTSGTFSGIRFRASNLSGNTLGTALSTIMTLTIITPRPPINFTSQTPPSATQKAEYTPYQFIAPAYPPARYSLSSRSMPLPLGMRLEEDGRLIGNPSIVGTFANIVVRATNSEGSIESSSFTLHVFSPRPPSNLVIQGSTNGIVGLPMHITLATDALPTSAFTLIEGLPYGLTREENNIIAGSPLVVGDFSVIVYAANNIGYRAFRLNLRINPRKDSLPLVADDSLRIFSGVAPIVGSIDTTFARNVRPNSNIWAIDRAVMATKGVAGFVIGGNFSRYEGRNARRVARIFADGKLDTTFIAGTPVEMEVYSLVVDPKSRSTIIGGIFFSGGLGSAVVMRLLHDGRLDSSFNKTGKIISEIGEYYGQQFVSALSLDSMGRILVGGSFNMMGGALRQNLCRLQSNGTLDTTFFPSQILPLSQSVETNTYPWYVIQTLPSAQNQRSRGVNGVVTSIRVQTDGRILVTGKFSAHLSPSFVRSRGIVRFLPDGHIDTNFIPTVATQGTGVIGFGYSAVQLPSGDVIFGGSFDGFGGIQTRSIVKLQAATMQPNVHFRSTGGGFVGDIHSLALLPKGQIFAEGSFSNYNGQYASTALILNGVTGELIGRCSSSDGVTGGLVSSSSVDDSTAILVGNFTHYDGIETPNIVKLRFTPQIFSSSIAKVMTRISIEQSTNVNPRNSDSILGGNISDVSVVPNPFNMVTEIRFKLENEENIRLTVCSLDGKIMLVLAEGKIPKGSYSVPFNAQESGLILSSGQFIYRLETQTGIIKSGILHFIR